MRITVEKHADGSFVVDITRQPLQEGRFKAACALAAAVVYAGLVIAVAALCGVPGVAVVGIATAIVGMFASSAML